MKLTIEFLADGRVKLSADIRVPAQLRASNPPWLPLMDDFKEPFVFPNWGSCFVALSKFASGAAATIAKFNQAETS